MITLIGSGNVATWMAQRLQRSSRFPITQVYSRTLANARVLADLCGAEAIDNIKELNPDNQVFIFALADNAYAQGEVVEAAVNETREMSESINQVINNMNDIKEESINTTRQAEDGTEKIADAVAFLCSQSAEYITGLQIFGHTMLGHQVFINPGIFHTQSS